MDRPRSLRKSLVADARGRYAVGLDLLSGLEEMAE